MEHQHETEMPAPRRVSARLGGWIENALDLHAVGETVSWEMNCILTPEGVQANILFVFASPLVGSETLVPAVLIQATRAMEEKMIQIVRDAVIAAHQEQARQLAPSNGGHPLDIHPES